MTAEDAKKPVRALCEDPAPYGSLPRQRADEIFDAVLAEVGDFDHLKPYRDAHFDFDVVFVDDARIKEINAQYRGKDCPTDVITFALFFDDENRVLTPEIHLGEIIISVDTAKRQAEENGVTLEKEFETLVAHGILHLLGFDHQTQEDYDFVVGIQSRVI